MEHGPGVRDLLLVPPPRASGLLWLQLVLGAARAVVGFAGLALIAAARPAVGAFGTLLIAAALAGWRRSHGSLLELGFNAQSLLAPRVLSKQQECNSWRPSGSKRFWARQIIGIS